MNKRKYIYTVHSMEYRGKNPRTMKPTGRMIPRPPQVLVEPQFNLHGLTLSEARKIGALEVGEVFTDHHGDTWERKE